MPKKDSTSNSRDSGVKFGTTSDYSPEIYGTPNDSVIRGVALHGQADNVHERVAAFSARP